MNSTPTGSLRCLTEQPDLLGESPFWHPVENCLYWVDIAGRAIRRRRENALVETFTLQEEPGCIAPAGRGGLLVALRSRVILFDPASGHATTLAPAPYDTLTTRFNDGRCDPQGRFWAGTVFEPKTAAMAGLYCLTPGTDGSWKMEQHLGGNVTANGLAFSPDSHLAWWSNTPAHLVEQYDFDPVSGQFSGARVFRQFDARAAGQPYGGRPDGVAIAADGTYWVAMYEGGRVLQLAADGTTLREITLPVRCPTMVCFGGSGLRTLFITTASKGRSAEELAAEPLAGHVLAIDLDTLGVPASVHGMPTAQWAPRR